MLTFFARTRKAIGDAPNKRVDEAFDENNAAKLVQMVDDILSDWMQYQARGESNGKFLVMIDRRCGWEALIRLLQECVRDDDRFGLSVSQISCYPRLPGSAVDEDILGRFNMAKNSDGSDVAIMIADSKEASEGVSFTAIRRLYLANVPTTWLEYQQLVGRAVRAFSHSHLAEADRDVAVRLYCATLPQIQQSCHVCDSECADTGEDAKGCWQCQNCQVWLCCKRCKKSHEAAEAHQDACGSATTDIVKWPRSHMKHHQTVEEKLLLKLQGTLQDAPPLRNLEAAAVDRQILRESDRSILDAATLAKQVRLEARIRKRQKREEKAAEDRTKDDLMRQLEQLKGKLELQSQSSSSASNAVKGTCLCCSSVGDELKTVFRCHCQNEDAEGLCSECFEVQMRIALRNHHCLRTDRVPCLNNSAAACDETQRLSLDQALLCVPDRCRVSVAEQLRRARDSERRRAESALLEIQAKDDELRVMSGFRPPVYWQTKMPKELNEFRGLQQSSQMKPELEVALVKEFQDLVDKTCHTWRLGGGPDQVVPGQYSRLKVVSVRRSENHLLWNRYKATMFSLQATREMLGFAGASDVQPQTEHQSCLGTTLQKRSSTLRPQVNEKYLFHGTSESSCKLIFSGGFNERFANNGYCKCIKIACPRNCRTNLTISAPFTFFVNRWLRELLC